MDRFLPQLTLYHMLLSLIQELTDFDRRRRNRVYLNNEEIHRKGTHTESSLCEMFPCLVKSQEKKNEIKNKQARPGNDASGLCLSVYLLCDICMERQMDKQTGEKTLKTCWLIIYFSVGSHRGQKQPRNAIFAQA